MSEDCMLERDLLFGEISRERAAQDEQWGGKTHDDSHERFEWLDWIHKQESRAFDVFDKPAAFESRMVKIAALAIAAIESSRRQRPNLTTPPVPIREVAEQNDATQHPGQSSGPTKGEGL